MRDLELARGMPSSLINDENGMSTQAHLGRDFFEVPLHGLGVAAGQNEGGADAACGADGAEDIGRLGALILRRSGPGSPPCPTPGDVGFLTNAGFILELNLYCGIGRQGLAERRHTGGEVFFKILKRPFILCMVAWACRDLDEVHPP